MKLYTHRRLRGGRTDRHGGAHQHHHADLLLRHLRRAAAGGGDRRDQERGEEDVRRQGRGDRPQELRGDRPDPGQPPRGEDPGGGARAPITRPPLVRPEAPEFVQKFIAADPGRPRRLAAGERHAGGRDLPDRPPRSGRSGTSPSRSRSGIPRSASSAASARWSARTPPSGPRSTTRSSWRRRRRPSSTTAYKGKEYPGMIADLPGRPGGLHRVRPVRRRLPGEEQDRGQAQGDQHGAQPPHPRRASASNYAFFLGIPDMDRGAGAGRPGEGLAASAAALRVLGRLRRLRRDART